MLNVHLQMEILLREMFEKYFFSENLQFKPVGVKGLGYDAKPQVAEGAAGLSSSRGGDRPLREEGGRPASPGGGATGLTQGC